ncbi:DUF6461 domain-containing protein [Nonomuraea sp. NPDC049725]|uniref:DUF6461 domain-containing protein n=1 Tax=Nonomuraea sp. NPDC049725 TaxID=3154508 RepID=UPI0034311B69
MIPNAVDYLWFNDDRFPDLADSYCFTLVRDMTPELLMTRLGAQAAASPRKTLDELITASYPDPGTFGTRDGKHFGTVSLGDWLLIVEVNGHLGVSRKTILPLSADTRLVSHSRNVNAVGYFYWVEDGEIRLFFDPLFPYSRHGSSPDELVEVMQRVGFDLAGDDSVSDNHDKAAFALAEHVTGVKLTPQLLEESTYLCGLVPPPR